MANKSMQAESYIVRIYRRGRDGTLVGMVETAIGGWQKPFGNVQELAAIFAAPKRRSRRAKQQRDTANEDHDVSPSQKKSIPLTPSFNDKSDTSKR